MPGAGALKMEGEREGDNKIFVLLYTKPDIVTTYMTLNIL